MGKCGRTWMIQRGLLGIQSLSKLIQKWWCSHTPQTWCTLNGPLVASESLSISALVFTAEVLSMARFLFVGGSSEVRFAGWIGFSAPVHNFVTFLLILLEVFFDTLEEGAGLQDSQTSKGTLNVRASEVCPRSSLPFCWRVLEGTFWRLDRLFCSSPQLRHLSPHPCPSFLWNAGGRDRPPGVPNIQGHPEC